MVVLIFSVENNNIYYNVGLTVACDIHNNLFLSNSNCQKSLWYDTKIVLTV